MVDNLVTLDLTRMSNKKIKKSLLLITKMRYLIKEGLLIAKF